MCLNLWKMSLSKIPIRLARLRETPFVHHSRELHTKQTNSLTLRTQLFQPAKKLQSIWPTFTVKFCNWRTRTTQFILLEQSLKKSKWGKKNHWTRFTRLILRLHAQKVARIVKNNLKTWTNVDMTTDNIAIIKGSCSMTSKNTWIVLAAKFISFSK